MGDLLTGGGLLDDGAMMGRSATQTGQRHVKLLFGYGRRSFGISRWIKKRAEAIAKAQIVVVPFASGPMTESDFYSSRILKPHPFRRERRQRQPGSSDLQYNGQGANDDV